jgi:hypothetical protein
MKGLFFLLLIFACAMCFSSCYNDKYDKLYPAITTTTTTCDTTTITYSHDVQPIIAANCYNPGGGCHDAAGSSVSGFNYTTYAGLVVNITDGSLLTDINFTPTRGHNSMPKGGTQLSACDINKITRWINQGYQNN